MKELRALAEDGWNPPGLGWRFMFEIQPWGTDTIICRLFWWATILLTNIPVAITWSGQTYRNRLIGLQVTQECFRLTRPVESVSCAGIRAQEVSSLRPSGRRQVAPKGKRIYAKKVVRLWILSFLGRLAANSSPLPSLPFCRLWDISEDFSLIGNTHFARDMAGHCVLASWFNPHRPRRAKKQSWHTPFCKMLTKEVSQEYARIMRTLSANFSPVPQHHSPVASIDKGSRTGTACWIDAGSFQNKTK